MAITVEKNRPSRNRPAIAVLPFRNISKDSSREFFADGLGEQLSTELTWFQELCVISYYSSRNVASKANDVREVGSLLGARYILTGSIQSDDQHLRVGVQLILSESGEQLWTKSFEKNNTAAGLFEIQNEIVQNILKAIGGYYGVIFRNVLNVRRAIRRKAWKYMMRYSGIIIIKKFLRKRLIRMQFPHWKKL